MNPCVPISINRIPKVTSGGLEKPLTSRTMLRIMIGCLQGVERLGKLGEQISSIKVEAYIPVMLSGGGDKAAYYIVRVTLRPPQPKLTVRTHTDDPEEPWAILRREARPNLSYMNRPKISIQEAVAQAIHEGVTGEIEMRIWHLEKNAQAWSKLVQKT